jgi:hypothetical protein
MNQTFENIKSFIFNKTCLKLLNRASASTGLKSAEQILFFMNHCDFKNVIFYYETPLKSCLNSWTF